METRKSLILNGIFESHLSQFSLFMRLFQDSAFFEGVQEIAQYMGTIKGKDKVIGSEHINPDVFKRLIAVCEDNEGEEPRFTIIKDELNELYELLPYARLDAHHVYGKCKEVLGKIYGLLAFSRLFIITTKEANFLDEKYALIKPLGEMYPDIDTDLFEAMMCWGLGRPTASVAHLMRSMEYAFKLLADHFSEPKISTHPTWNAKLVELKKKIDLIAVKEERDYYENIHSDLNTVRRRWRNNTMHLEQIYGAEEARHIFDAVITLLQDLSEKLTPQQLSLPQP